MNSVVHFEMPYQDAGRVARFYEKAFGWQMQQLGEEMGKYVLATTANEDVKPDAFRGAINGGFFPASPDGPAHPSVVVGVPDIRATMSRIEDAGGKVLGEPMEIPGIGQYVSFTDTEGNRASLLEPRGM